MPNKGYWIECVPLNSERILMTDNDLYTASIDGFPEMDAIAPSPDQAIEALRHKLLQARQSYQRCGRLLPEAHNPVRPPSQRRTQQGWLSVYIEIDETTQASH